MDEHQPQAHALHEHHVLEQAGDDLGILKGRATQLDHNQPVSKPANPAGGFDEDLGLLRGF